MVQWSDLCDQLYAYHSRRETQVVPGRNAAPGLPAGSFSFGEAKEACAGSESRAALHLLHAFMVPLPHARLFADAPIHETLSLLDGRLGAAQQPSPDEKVRPRIGFFGNDSGDGIAVIPLC